MDDRDDVSGPLGIGSGDPSRPFAVGGSGDAPQRPTYSDPPPPILDDHPPHYHEPIAPLNPWIAVLYRPRDTIRYVLDTGEWGNWIIVYSILYLLAIPPGIVSMFAQPNTMDILSPDNLPFALSMGVVMVLAFGFFIVLAYPIALLFVMLNAWLYKVIGGWLGGVGTTAELRLGSVWGSAVFSYIQYVAIVPNGVAAFYIQTADQIDETFALMLAGITGLLMLPLYIYGAVINCKVVGEAHRFSAWRGFGTVLLTALLVAFVVFGFVLAMMVIVFIIAAAA